MTTETKRLIRVRTEKGAVFKRDGFGKKRQLSDSWRKPRGQHNKQREQKKAKGNLPKPGFGSPVAVRGMHPSGFFEVLVFTEKDLEKLDAKIQAIRISAGVGARKRKILQEKAVASGFKILNTHVIKERVAEEAETSTTPEKEAKAKKATKETKKEAPAKKTASKAENAKKKGTMEKKPVKAAASKSKPESKETPKKEEKAAKPKAKSAVKVPAQKSAPAKSEKKQAVAVEKPKAENAKAKKKSSSGVKKND